jgi:short-subunit dehydrogenase
MMTMHKQSFTLITGASQGFGKALAIECARRRLNLILVALPGESLPAVVAAIRQEYGVEAVAIEANLCEEEACQGLLNQVKALDLPVNMLINNAGIGSTELFENETFTQYERQIRLNVLATTRLTHLFLPMLQQNSPAYILNVGSLASFFSLQKKQVYGATKSFVYYFSKSLRRELKRKQVYVSVVCPGGMYTNPVCRHTIASGDYLSRASGMHPEDVAPIALNGLLRKKEVIVPGKINWWLVFLDRFVPRFVVRFLEERTMKRLQAPKTATVCPLERGDAVYGLPQLQRESIHSSNERSTVC